MESGSGACIQMYEGLEAQGISWCLTGWTAISRPRSVYDVKRQASEMLMSGCASLLPLQLFLRERLLQTAGPSQSIAGRLRERNNWPEAW